MKATEAKLLEFLKKSPQFVVPIYQRTYSWTERECRQLWDDILRTGRDDTISAHFMGSIVYVEKTVARSHPTKRSRSRSPDDDGQLLLAQAHVRFKTRVTGQAMSAEEHDHPQGRIRQN
jgi:hypothetical protein